MNKIPYYNDDYECPICNNKPGYYDYEYFDHWKRCGDFEKLKLKDNEDFKVIKHYRDGSPEQLKTVSCNNCGSEEFTVGHKTFFTAVKCKNCGMEASIHEG